MDLGRKLRERRIRIEADASTDPVRHPFSGVEDLRFG